MSGIVDVPGVVPAGAPAAPGGKLDRLGSVPASLVLGIAVESVVVPVVPFGESVIVSGVAVPAPVVPVVWRPWVRFERRSRVVVVVLRSWLVPGAVLVVLPWLWLLVPVPVVEPDGLLPVEVDWARAAAGRSIAPAMMMATLRMSIIPRVQPLNYRLNGRDVLLVARKYVRPDV